MQPAAAQHRLQNREKEGRNVSAGIRTSNFCGHMGQKRQYSVEKLANPETLTSEGLQLQHITSDLIIS